MISVSLNNANKDILNNIDNNTNLVSKRLGEIQITSVPQAEMTLPKRVYSIDNKLLSIPAGRKLSLSAGSMLKLPVYKILSVYGTLELNGTSENKVIVTSTEDIGVGVSSYDKYWKYIDVSESGTLKASNTDINYGGVDDYFLSPIADSYIKSRGDITLDNVDTTNCKILYLDREYYSGSICCNGGNISILNSNIPHYISLNNLKDIDIENSNLNQMDIFNLNISNNGQNVLNNVVTNGILYTPNTLSNININNNTSLNSYPLSITCKYNTDPNIFKKINNNRNKNNRNYDGIYVNDNINNLNFTSNNSYIIKYLTIPNDKTLEIEAGTICKFLQYGYITVNGNFIINGAKDNIVKLTSINDSSVNPDSKQEDYIQGIVINSSGKAIINNMEMKYCGYSKNSAIYNNGKLYLINSSITNMQSGNAISYGKTSTDQILKYNCIGGSVSSNIPIDASYNYWNASDGPKRYNYSTSQYEGSGSPIDNNTYWSPYNTSFIKTNLTLDTYINDTVKTERQHFGEDGVSDYTGNYSRTYDDLKVVIPNIDLSFSRTYNSKNISTDILGRGWTFGFSTKVDTNPLNSNIVYVYLPNGSVNTFIKQSDDSFKSDDSRNTLTIENGNYVLTTKEQTKYLFDSNRYLYKIIDKYGNENNITVDSNGKITKVVDYANRTYTISYDNNKLSKITDPIGRTIVYNYNSQGLLSEVIGLSGKSTYYEYDTDGYMTNVKEKDDSDNIVTVESMTYGNYEEMKGKRLQTIKDSSGKIDTYEYNVSDRITTIVDQNNRVTIKYFDDKGYPTKILEPDNSQTVISYELSDGVNKYNEIKSKTDINEATTSYVRDTNGNILRQTNADGSVKSYEYNSKNSLTKEVDEVGNITQYEYDTDGITLVKKILPNNANNTFEYIQGGIKGLVGKKTDENGNSITYEYDKFGNLAKQTNALGNSETYSYNDIGWLMSKTTCEGYTTTYEYDNSGNNTKVVENTTATTNNEYNYKNKITKKTDANGNDITYTYDNSQNLIKKVDQEGNTYIYEYDIYNNIIKETKPNGAIYIYDYDNLNRNIKKSVMLNDNQTTLEEKSYTYYNGNTTVTTKDYSNATDYTTNIKITNYLDKVTSDKTEDAAKTNTYLANGLLSMEQDELGRRIYYTYNSIGKVATKYEEIDNGLYKITKYEYDLAGNVIKEQTSQKKVALNTEPSVYITTNYTYDAINNLVLKTTSSGEEIKYTYDKDKNKIKEESKIEDGRYKTTEYTYNYAKKPTSKKEYIEKGSIVSNSIDDATITTLDTTYEYDNMNNIIKETAPDAIVINYYYDKLNRQTKKEIVKDDTTITTLASYLYDTKDKVTSKTDGNGNTTTYDYDIFGNILKETKPGNIITTYEYNLFGNPVKQILPNNIDNNQNNTVFTYDKYGNAITKAKNYIEDGVQKQIVTNYEYDLKKNIVKETTSNISKLTSYNKVGKVISKTDGNGNISTTDYDANLNKIKEVTPLGISTKYYYDERNNLIKKTIDDVIQEENSYDLINNKISQKDELGKVLTNTYDIDGNLVKQVNAENGYMIKNQYTQNKKVARIIDNLDKEILNTYDILGNIVEQTEQKSDGTQKITTKTKYDNVSNKIEETDGNGNVTKYEYDPAYNKIIKETNPKEQTTTYTYDKNGNKLKETDYLGNTLSYTYDNLDRLILKKDQYDTEQEKLVYDDLGRQIKSIDANNNIIEYTFDGNDNVLTKKDQEGFAESYEYDGANNKIKSTDKNGNITKYKYNNKNKVIKVTDALNHSTTYTYDNKENLLTQTDAAGNITEYQYDKNSNEIKKIDQLYNEESKTYYLNGLQKTFTSNKGDVFNYTYDIHDRLISEKVGQDETIYEYDNNDNKTKIGSVTKTYDSLNRLLTNTENGNTVTYSYDDATKTKTITDPKDNVTKEEYDKANRLQKVINTDKTTEYVYNIDGSVQKQINPNNTTIYEYYPDKKTKHLTTTDESGILLEEHKYEYDSNNNVLKEDDKNYTYDALNRIKTSDNTTYSYDLAGNILTKTTIDGTNTTVISNTYDSKNELLDTVTKLNDVETQNSAYTYDSNGNQISDKDNINNKTITNIYNSRNELIQVDENDDTLSTYTYNAEGKRIQKQANNKTINYVYDNKDIILELDDSNNQTATNVYGLALLKRNTTNQEGYYLYNGHGDVTKIVDNSNATLNTYAYDEYGKVLNATENIDNPFKYAGYYYDNETGNYYLQARYYNPDIQRFISEDTYRGQLDDPLSLNLYTYCSNNPLIYTDPDGHFPSLSDAWDFTKNVVENIVESTKAIFSVNTLKNIPVFTKGLIKNIPNSVEYYMSNKSPAWEITEAAFGKTIIGKVQLNKEEINARYNKATNNMLNGVIYSYADDVTIKTKGLGFNSFKELKNNIGSAGEGNQWHHIVEQSQIEKSGFSPQQIHNTDNIVAIDKVTHQQISAYYSRKYYYTNGLRLRDWIANKSFQEQYNYGIKIINMFKK